MKISVFLISFFPFLVFGKTSLPMDAKNKVRELFKSEDACFFLKEGRSQTLDLHWGGKTCEISVKNTTSFLLPLILLASEKGLIQDEKTLFKWDGTRFDQKSWNKDQFALDWIQNQVGWVTDRLLLQLQPRNLDQFTKKRLALQLPLSLRALFNFMERFSSSEMELKNGAQELAKRLLYVGKFRGSSEVWGIKGSGSEGAFFVGFMTQKNQRWTWLTFLEKKGGKSTENYSAERAQALSMDALTELGLL